MTQPAQAPRWRVGRSLGRTLYRDDVWVGELHGLTVEEAAEVVGALNGSDAREAEARRMLALFLERSTDFGSGPLRVDARRWLGLPLLDEGSTLAAPPAEVPDDDSPDMTPDCGDGGVHQAWCRHAGEPCAPALPVPEMLRSLSPEERAAAPTVPTCEEWCGKTRSPKSKFYPCRGDPQCRGKGLEGMCACSDACRDAGRAVNPAPPKAPTK